MDQIEFLEELEKLLVELAGRDFDDDTQTLIAKELYEIRLNVLAIDRSVVPEELKDKLQRLRNLFVASDDANRTEH